MRWRSAAAVLLVFGAGDCARPPAPRAPAPIGIGSPIDSGYSSPRYRDPKMWLCAGDRPGALDDPCHRGQAATEIRPDGSRVVVPPSPAREPEVDCFYVYPTVDMTLAPANHEDLDDVRPMAEVTRVQAGRFTEACAVYAPLYRQVTIGTYFRSEESAREYFDVAFSDVADAFLHYMAQYNHGRKIVLLGHSQGGQMVVRLLQRFFDGDPKMRERLLYAMPIGWKLDAPPGKDRGGTLQNVPLCTRRDQEGCVIAFRSFSTTDDAVTAGMAAPRPGNVSACVNPADLAAGSEGRRFARSYLPLTEQARRYMRGVEGIDTPFVLMRDYYGGRCVDGANGFRYLAVGPMPAEDDARGSLFDFDARIMKTKLGLHLLDVQFPQGDLVDLIVAHAHR